MPFEGFAEVSNTITEYLTAAGWQRTTRSRESEVPEFVTTNGRMRTSIFQSTDDKSLMLTLVDVATGTRLRFDVRYENSIGSLLGILAAWHEHLSIDNFGSMIRTMSLEVPGIYAEPAGLGPDSPWEQIYPGADSASASAAQRSVFR